MRQTNLIIGLLLNCSLSTLNTVVGQVKTNNTYGKGHKLIANDSTYYLRFNARIQTLYVGVLDQGTDNYSDQMMIRRSRLKFDGWALTPKLSYKFELGLSNRDIASGNIPQSRKCYFTWTI